VCKRGGFDTIKVIDLKGKPENGSFRHGILFPMTAEFQPLKNERGLYVVDLGVPTSKCCGCNWMGKTSGS